MNENLKNKINYKDSIKEKQNININISPTNNITNKKFVFKIADNKTKKLIIYKKNKDKINITNISKPKKYSNNNNLKTNLNYDIKNISSKYNSLPYNNRYANSLDKKSINYNRERENRKSQNYNLRRKSIDRGENKNVRITHIIYSNMDIDFHITDPLDITTEESRRKYRGSVDKSNKYGKNGNVKVTYSSSCENVKIIPKQKSSNVGKIEYIKHRENPHLKRININNNNNNKSNVVNNYSKIYSVKNSNPLNKNQKRKYNF